MVKERHRKTLETALKQGKVDEQMQGLCSFIAGTRGFYTSSCCSGRIIMLEKRGERKTETFFHRKWHRTVDEDELIDGLAEGTSGEVWLKVDPFILHIGCLNIWGANAILAAMKNAGVKRGGIIVAKEGKFIVELQGTERLGAPVKVGRKILVQKEYIKYLAARANALLERNYRRLAKLEQEFRKVLE